MTDQQKEFYDNYLRQIHRIGRFTLIVSVILLIGVPFVFGFLFDAMPSGKGFLAGIAKVAAIYVACVHRGISRLCTYARRRRKLPGVSHRQPDQLKNPVCHQFPGYCQGPRQHAGKRDCFYTEHRHQRPCNHGRPLCRCPAHGTPAARCLQSPVLAPAFDTVVPALFGALGLKYFLKSPKIAVIPIWCL